MADAGIVRNRLKIDATVANARAFLAVKKEVGSFDTYIWRFDDAKAMSRDLAKRGFKFIGPTICYAFMQATGMVNDHAPTCFKSPNSVGASLVQSAYVQPEAGPSRPVPDAVRHGRGHPVPGAWHRGQRGHFFAVQPDDPEAAAGTRSGRLVNLGAPGVKSG
jgi:hypothetical protein